MKQKWGGVKKESYNEVPYISKSFYSTQPEYLKTMMLLFGFETPALKKARVLEIGCSFGGNIIPFAIANPDATVIGIDLAEVQIEEGKKIIERLEIQNLHLYCQNILEYRGEFGKFDYIICHGVFSWVPENVQNKILEVVKDSLVENGVAVISYNTYPGWKNLDILRDMMLFKKNYTSKQGLSLDPLELVESGKEGISFLKEHTSYTNSWKEKIEHILGKAPYYVYHEYFEENNNPFYLYQFNEMLQEKGLTHLCDAELTKTLPNISSITIEIEEFLSKECKEDRIAREQYYDFLRNVQFRKSIITHLEKKDEILISRDFRISDLKKLYVRADIIKTEENEYKLSTGEVLLEEYSDLAEFFIENKMKFSSFEEVINYPTLIGDSENPRRLLTMIYNRDIEFTSEAITIKEEECLKLNERYRKYLQYHIEEENPVISMGNYQGKLFDVSKLQLQIMTLFDGTKTVQDIADEIRDQVTVHQGTLEGFIENIKYMMEINLMNQ